MFDAADVNHDGFGRSSRARRVRGGPSRACSPAALRGGLSP
jgi:hypothetical protein